MYACNPLWSGLNVYGQRVEIAVIHTDNLLCLAIIDGEKLDCISQSGKRGGKPYLLDYDPSMLKKSDDEIDICHKVALALSASDKPEQAKGAMLCAKELQKFRKVSSETEEIA